MLVYEGQSEYVEEGRSGRRVNTHSLAPDQYGDY